jgi:hypothetical protein
MANLEDVRGQIRAEAGEASGGEAWSDEGLDRHITRALEELSAAWPREETADIATTVGSRELSLATIAADMLDVEAVEYPLGHYPPSMPAFGTWNGALQLHLDRAPDGSDARVHYTARHELDGEGTTLTAFQVELLVAGASGYAALERSVSLANRLATGDEAAEKLSAYARARLTAFRQLLHQYGRKNRVRARRLYVPA